MKPNSFDHFFKILGLSPTHMNVKEIEKAYKKAALKCHPDRSRSIEEKERNAVTYNFITTTKDLSLIHI